MVEATILSFSFAAEVGGGNVVDLIFEPSEPLGDRLLM